MLNFVSAWARIPYIARACVCKARQLCHTSQEVTYIRSSVPVSCPPAGRPCRRALRLWRDGLALTPDNIELKDEDAKYNALAFWLGNPDRKPNHRSGSTMESIGEQAGKGGRANDTPVPFSCPPPRPPLLQQEENNMAGEPVLGDEVGGSKIQPSASVSEDRSDGCGANINLNLNDSGVRQFADNLDLEFMGGGEWVCKTRVAPLSRDECAAVIAEAEETASANRAAIAAAASTATETTTTAEDGGGSGWGTARHYAVPTTDMAVRDLPRTLAWFNAAMRTRIGPLVAAAAALGSGEIEGPADENSVGENVKVCGSNRFSGIEEAVGAEKDVKLEDVTIEAHGSRENVHEWRKDENRGAVYCNGSVNNDVVVCSDTFVGSHSEGKTLSESRLDVSGIRKTEAQERIPYADSATGGGAAAARAAAANSDADAFVRRLRVHDAFVVRYDSAAQRSLPLHTDQGEISLTIALNSSDDFDGGGTWFEGLGRAIRPSDAGHIVVFPGGDTMHGGQEITRGIRYILAVFLYEHWTEEEEEEEKGEEEEEGGEDEESGGEAHGDDEEEYKDEQKEEGDQEIGE